MSKKPVVLMILDGYGLNDNCEANAVCEGKTPIGSADEPVPICQRTGKRYGSWSSGRSMGNSEVGHLNMGAGRSADQG